MTNESAPNLPSPELIADELATGLAKLQNEPLENSFAGYDPDNKAVQTYAHPADRSQQMRGMDLNRPTEDGRAESAARILFPAVESREALDPFARTVRHYERLSGQPVVAAVEIKNPPSAKMQTFLYIFGATEAQSVRIERVNTTNMRALADQLNKQTGSLPPVRENSLVQRKINNFYSTFTELRDNYPQTKAEFERLEGITRAKQEATVATYSGSLVDKLLRRKR
jgi:hypothetical protein